MSSYALVSVHPSHICNILSGRKVFEYRKVLPSRDVSHLVLYSTAPEMKVVAVVEVLERLVGTPSRIWDMTRYGAGISRSYFREYFSGKRSASAFLLGNVFEMKKPMALSELLGNRHPPQSFYYLNEANFKAVSDGLDRKPKVRSSMLFVGGVHGVGKSTVCQRVFSPFGYRCQTASSLILAYGKEVRRDKRVADVSDNQMALIKQLSLSRRRHSRFVLDGHFTVVGSDGDIKPIGPDVFRQMNLDLLVLIKGGEKEIAQRLTLRDGGQWDVDFLKKFQREEEAHARYVSTEIQVPLLVYDSSVGYARLADEIRKFRDA